MPVFTYLHIYVNPYLLFWPQLFCKPVQVGHHQGQRSTVKSTLNIAPALQ